MKKLFVMLGITSVLIMSFQTYTISGIYAINEDTNTKMDIDTTNISKSMSLDVAENVTSIYDIFNDIISEGKSTLLNVQDIKPNTVIKYNIIACLGGHIFEGQFGELGVVDCDRIGIFTASDPTTTNSSYTSNQLGTSGGAPSADSVNRLSTPGIASSLLTAINQGIERPIEVCYYHSGDVDVSVSPRLQMIDCGEISVIYK